MAKLVISKILGIHEDGFRLTQQMHEFNYKHSSMGGDRQRISEPMGLILRNKTVLKITSSIREEYITLEVYKDATEVLYFSGPLPKPSFTLISTFEDGLSYKFELRN